MNNLKVLTNGIFKENPTFALLLGMCPTLGVTPSAINGMGMGLATAFVLVMSNLVISLVTNIIPDKIRIPSFIVIIAAFVTVVDMCMAAYLPSLHESLGLFIPLIVVNCIVLGRAEAFAQGCICIILLLIFLLSNISWLAVLLMCLCTTCLFALSSPQQILLIRHSKGGEMLGAASVQVAFNLGNAIGAYCGGLPLQAGMGYLYPALVGAPFALIGFTLLTIFYRKYEKKLKILNIGNY